ncbi:MAG: Lrp/AsnC family transcriptional regulator [Kiritimatiellaceae bacterium]|nr:Lrp/AsnC family transcriptional regulator [Kiritimatiellaceae bacterium]
MIEFSDVEKMVLTRLQRGVLPVERPFKGFELPEDSVVELLIRAKQQGILRRFGGIFDARRLGYQSVLCAYDCASELIDKKAALIAEHPGVTHCYERRPLHGSEPYPPLWFTLAMLRDEFHDGIASLRAQLKPECGTLYELPALQRFKVDVVFDLHGSGRDELQSGINPATLLDQDDVYLSFSTEEKQLVRAMDQHIPLVTRPFAQLAEELGQTEQFFLETLTRWKEQGVLRRIGAILYHRKVGFSANAMCVWPIDGDVAEAGRRVAQRPEVTHCYQRPRMDGFPFDLYAMIHTQSWEQAEALYQTISTACELRAGRILGSVREFKKSSMTYFR